MAAPGENLRTSGNRLGQSIHEMAGIGPGVATARAVTATSCAGKGHAGNVAALFAPGSAGVRGA